MYTQSTLERAFQNLTPEQIFQNLEAALLHNALLKERNLLLEEKIRLLLIKKYGSGAETLSDAQLALFELEPRVCAAEVAAEAGLSPEDKALAQQLLAGAPSGKKRNRPVRAPVPQNLERKERTIHVPAKDCVCSQCGKAKKTHRLRNQSAAGDQARRILRGVDQSRKTRLLPLRGNGGEHRTRAGLHH
jgi:hypothetical protein